jgi:nucleoside-diphosphate kinase
MEQTLLVIKPEVVTAPAQRVGEILAIVNRAGFRLVDLVMRRLDRQLVERFYAEHAGKPFYPALVDYICSGPIVAARLERQEAVRRLRELIGATDPEQAATGTLRFLYGSSLTCNAVHGSSSVADAQRELAIIFGE